ncbi:lysophospholipid acyltransferase family protein [Aestuariibacter salexigens]|uniref:lysophospholipid acyltransferase family protein n=1 Tax=Aestuariibacter salexigens TaxID=226010 RepID=UPI00042791AC|nr:lysophospholipid acyltransferase family protein [Aestuariibacter salexigens]
MKKDPFQLPDVGNNVPRGGNAFTHWLGKTYLKLSGWSFTGQLPDRKKMVIAVAPHTSNWDFFVGLAVLFALRLKINFLGKHTIFIPPISWFLRAIGGIPVDRRSTHGVVGNIAMQLKEKQQTILAIAPEGTRSPVFPWKTGFLQIANQANMPVLLIGFDFSKKQIQFGPLFEVNGDIESHMHTVYDFYATVQGKYPDNVVFPENKA